MSYQQAFDYICRMIEESYPTSDARQELIDTVFYTANHKPQVNFGGNNAVSVRRMIREILKYGEIAARGWAIALIGAELKRVRGVNHHEEIDKAIDILCVPHPEYTEPDQTLLHRPTLPVRVTSNNRSVSPSHIFVRDLIDRGVQTIPYMATADRESTAKDAFNIFAHAKTTCLAVVDKDGQFVGWVSHGDIIELTPPFLTSEDVDGPLSDDYINMREALTESRFAQPISRLMYTLNSERRSLEFLLEGDTLLVALRKFLNPIGLNAHVYLRKIPVLSSNYRMVSGVLGYWMIVSRLAAKGIIPNVSVGYHMLTINRVNRIVDTMSLDDVLFKAHMYGWAHIAITNAQGEFVGMTSIEKLKRMADADIRIMNNRPVSKIMRRAERCTVISPRDPISQWLHIFKDDDIGALPVVEDGHLVGILSYVHVLSAFHASLNSTNKFPSPPPAR